MKNFRKRLFPLVPVLALLLSLAIGAIKAKTAALLPPCQERQMIEAIVPSPQAATERPNREPSRKVKIFIFDGVQIVDYAGQSELLSHARNGTAEIFNTTP
jgi:hypothetical protein